MMKSACKAHEALGTGNCVGASSGRGGRLEGPECAESHRAGSLVHSGCAHRPHGGQSSDLRGQRGWEGLTHTCCSGHNKWEAGLFHRQSDYLWMPNAVMLPTQG